MLKLSAPLFSKPRIVAACLQENPANPDATERRPKYHHTALSTQNLAFNSFRFIVLAAAYAAYWLLGNHMRSSDKPRKETKIRRTNFTLKFHVAS
ncbi:hypothetical protein HYFRA_00005091 [Hymenoscyphus fraxineus]|uniref:Uncharacterized protein n=1 Tax=Hymenoscyphus fraxineus TaxID=746836 RepID=A0A9N9LAH0_9HELO|nr:hypothetical protein HYFRA_00005091 [Hymenoscyphus fraxineus]